MGGEFRLVLSPEDRRLLLRLIEAVEKLGDPIAKAAPFVDRPSFAEVTRYGPGEVFSPIHEVPVSEMVVCDDFPDKPHARSPACVNPRAAL